MRPQIDAFVRIYRALNGCGQDIDLFPGRMINVDDQIGPKGDDTVFAAAGAGPAFETGLRADAAEMLCQEPIQLLPEQQIGLEGLAEFAAENRVDRSYLGCNLAKSIPLLLLIIIHPIMISLVLNWLDKDRRLIN